MTFSLSSLQPGTALLLLPQEGSTVNLQFRRAVNIKGGEGGCVAWVECEQWAGIHQVWANMGG